LPDSAYAGAMETPSSRLDRFQSLLLESHSASAVLADWILGADEAAHRLAARKLQSQECPATADQRARLAVTEPKALHHRRVCLVAAGRVLSVADNWYVPARLSSDMLARFIHGVTPFGAAIVELGPRRKTLSVERIAHLEELVEGERPPAWLLKVRALVIDRHDRPLCEVSETYSRNILL